LPNLTPSASLTISKLHSTNFFNAGLGANNGITASEKDVEPPPSKQYAFKQNPDNTKARNVFFNSIPQVLYFSIRQIPASSMPACRRSATRTTKVVDMESMYTATGIVAMALTNNARPVFRLYIDSRSGRNDSWINGNRMILNNVSKTSMSTIRFT
jgi:hypothetical protein